MMFLSTRNVFAVLSTFIFLGFSYIVFGYEYIPVDELDLSSYDGRWYQVYKDVSDMSFQGFGTCAVADYAILDANNVSVLNSQIDKDGTLDQITGYAFYKDGNSGGELTVDLDGTPGNAPYWVIQLGPLLNDDYQYSIVSDNLKLSLFVLARNVSEFYDLYDEEVLKSLEKYGFTKNINKPLVMEQVDCDYSLYD
jgi:lipocalin